MCINACLFNAQHISYLALVVKAIYGLLRSFNWLLKKSLKCDRKETIIKFALKLPDFLNWFLMENVPFWL